MTSSGGGGKEELRRVPEGFARPGVGQVAVFVGQPGSGKSTMLRHLVSNAHRELDLSEADRPRMLVVSSGGAERMEYDEVSVGKCFDGVTECRDIVSELDRLEEVTREFRSCVILLDDLVTLTSTELLRLTKLIYKQVRHSKLLILAAIHTATHLPSIGSLLRLAVIIVLHTSISNVASVRRLRQLFGWEKTAELALVEELRRMELGRQREGAFDAILIHVPSSLAVMNVQTRPVSGPKRRVSDLNRALDLVAGGMAPTFFYLVPENRLRIVKGEHSERDHFLSLFSRESDRGKVGQLLDCLAPGPGGCAVDFENAEVTVGKKRCNLLDLCCSACSRKRKMTPSVRGVVLEMERRSVKLPEVGALADAGFYFVDLTPTRLPFQFVRVPPAPEAGRREKPTPEEDFTDLLID